MRGLQVMCSAGWWKNLSRCAAVAMAGGAAALATGNGAHAGQLALRSGEVEIAAQTPMQAAAALRAVSKSGSRYAIVQFQGPVGIEQRAELAEAGVQLQHYVGSDAYVVALGANGFDANRLTRVAAPFSVAAIQPHFKVHPMLVNGAAPDHAVVGRDANGDAIVGVYVLFHKNVDINEAAGVIFARHNALWRDTFKTINGAVVELSATAILNLATEDQILWIEPALPALSDINAENRVITQTNLVNAAPYNLDGSGVTVMVFDGGIARASHVDFNGRLTTHDSANLSNHATHVSGTIGGSGTANANNRGMAPGVLIRSFGFQWGSGGIFLYTNPGDIEQDYAEAINNLGAHIANNSIGTNTETNGFPCEIQGDYGLTDSIIDGIVRGSLSNTNEPFRIIWAGGNERQGSSCDIEGFGDYYSTAPPATAKNHITVGALNANDDSMTSFSSWGPTDDGRMKPDIAAPGCQSGGDNGVTSCSSSSDTAYSVSCGTSMACPTVTGLASLLLEDFRAQFSGLPDPRNSTLKILFAHTAQDLGNPGPDYQYGYGSVRIKNAIDFMRLGHFTESEMLQGGVLEYEVNVPPGTPLLKTTLAWDDAPAVPLAATALVNDLDVVAVDPNGNLHWAWTLDPLNPSAPAVRTGANIRDNLEQVLVNNPMAGTWTIRVVGANVPEGPQPFSICASPDLETPPALFIGLPNGTPSTLPAGAEFDLAVSIVPHQQTVIPGSPALHVRYVGGEFIEIPLEHVSGNNYTATLPPATCQAMPEFYVSAEGSISGPVTNPPNAPASVYEFAVGQDVQLANNTFEGGAGGWVGGQPGDTASTGQWVLVDPIGTDAQPEDDHTPAPGTMCWVTGQGTPGGTIGEADVDGGFTTLLSPVFDLSASANPLIRFWRWYSNTEGAAPLADVFLIDITSDNGSKWTNAITIGPSGSGVSGGWLFSQIDVAQFFTPTSHVRLRFIAQDLNAGSLVEAAVDDFVIVAFQCTATLDDCNANGIVDSDDIASGRSDDNNSNGIPDECEGPPCPADIDGNQVVNVDDLLSVINSWGNCPTGNCPADIDNNGIVNVDDLLAVINAWGDCP